MNWKTRMTSRFVAVCMALSLLPAGGLTSAAFALETPNAAKESYAFYQRSTDRILSANDQRTVDDTTDFKSFYSTASHLGRQQSEDNTSWAFAAIQAIDASYGEYLSRQIDPATGLPRGDKASDYKEGFSDTHMIFSLSTDSGNTLGFSRKYNEAGNRIMTTAYLMRGLLGGPVSGFPSYAGTTYILPQNLKITGDNGVRHFVSGVTYIPEAQTTGGKEAADLYIKRIKDAVYTYGAAAASLYMDTSAFYEGTLESDYDAAKPASGTIKDIYHYPYKTTADHSVTIVGWNDTPWKYEVPAPTTDEPNKTTTFEHKGAFLVRDSMIDGGAEYWVSYETALSGAYFVEGFVDQDRAENFASTYEYDVLGFNNAMGYNSTSAMFANVFTVATAAEALEAVSVFLTGENSTVTLYYIPDYSSTDDLLNLTDPALSKGIPIVQNVTKTLPGYYCFPLEFPLGDGGDELSSIVLGAKGTKFAIAAVVNCEYSTSPIPVQSISHQSAASGRSYISSKGTTWTDSYAQGQATVCLKAHVQTDIDIPLTDVSVAHTTDTETKEVKTVNVVKATASDEAKAILRGFGNNGTLNALNTAPGLSYNLGPVYQPLNATDVAAYKTVWRFYDDNGVLLAQVDQSSDDVVRIEKYKEYAEDEEKPSVPTFQFSTGKLTMPKDVLSGTYIVTVEVCTFASSDDKDKKDTERALSGQKYYGEGAVVVTPVAVSTITVNKTEASIKAGSTVTIAATVSPKDTSYSAVSWRVAKSYTYDKNTEIYTYEASKPFNPGDPYSPDGPIVKVSDGGKVTGLRDGVCYVYAEITQKELGEEGVSVTSPPVKITVAKSDPTGITAGKKKVTMSSGTTLTLTATVKPSAASNKRITWASDNTDVVRIVDPVLGIAEGVKPGVATITATNALGHKCETVVTVTGAPSSTIKLTKSSTLSLTGAATSDTVVWEITEDGLEYNVDEPLNSTYFTAAASGKNKLKLTAGTVGGITVRAYVQAAYIDESGNETQRTVLEQSWRIYGVVALTKAVLQDETGTAVSKVTLCVDPKGKIAPQTTLLTAVVVKPADATLLDFEWTSSKPEVATVETVEGDNQNNVNIRLKAVGIGSTKLTGTNYNSNKKVTVTVKVLAYPSGIAFKKAGPITLAIGKSTSLKATVSGERNLNKTVAYSLEDENGNTLDNDNDIAQLGKNGKVRAVGEGTVYLVARGAPYTATSVTARMKIVCKTLVKKVNVSAVRKAAAGMDISLNISVGPSDATVQDVSIMLSGTTATLVKESDGSYTLKNTKPGRLKVTVTSVDNPKKKKSFTITIV